MSGYFKKKISKKLSEETLILAFDASRQIAFFKDFDYLSLFDSLWNILIHYWWLMFCSAVGQFYQLMKKRFPAIF